jgi:Tol biopolymer transport system component
MASSQGEGDVSHDGLHIATFLSQSGRTVLAILSRDGSPIEHQIPLPDGATFRSPRWSPDDRWIAFDVISELAFNHTIYITEARTSAPKPLVNAGSIQGVAWLPDGSGLVYASSAGSTMAYPPIYNLRIISKDGRAERELTFGDESYTDPDLVTGGRVFVSHVKMQSDIWRYPVAGSAKDNTKNGVAITHQTGQIQTPSVSPDGKQVVYLSDSGGHANLWVAQVDGSSPPRQISFDRDPAEAIGIPIWSPAGDKIVFVRINAGVPPREWLINPDGSGAHEFLPDGKAAVWSAQGQWLYYTDGKNCIKKISMAGGASENVRCEANSTGISSDGSTMYYVPSVIKQNEIFKAQPASGPGHLLARYSPSRSPWSPNNYALSPDDRSLAVPLKDVGTTNIWTISTADGSFHQITDFQRPTLIARQVSWAPDGKSIYAAVVDIDADVTAFDRMLP